MKDLLKKSGGTLLVSLCLQGCLQNLYHQNHLKNDQKTAESSTDKLNFDFQN